MSQSDIRLDNSMLAKFWRIVALLQFWFIILLNCGKCNKLN